MLLSNVLENQQMAALEKGLGRMAALLEEERLAVAEAEEAARHAPPEAEESDYDRERREAAAAYLRVREELSAPGEELEAAEQDMDASRVAEGRTFLERRTRVVIAGRANYGDALLSQDAVAADLRRALRAAPEADGAAEIAAALDAQHALAFALTRALDRDADDDDAAWRDLRARVDELEPTVLADCPRGAEELAQLRALVDGVVGAKAALRAALANGGSAALSEAHEAAKQSLADVLGVQGDHVGFGLLLRARRARDAAAVAERAAAGKAATPARALAALRSAVDAFAADFAVEDATEGASKRRAAPLRAALDLARASRGVAEPEDALSRVLRAAERREKGPAKDVDHPAVAAAAACLRLDDLATSLDRRWGELRGSPDPGDYALARAARDALAGAAAEPSDDDAVMAVRRACAAFAASCDVELALGARLLVPIRCDLSLRIVRNAVTAAADFGYDASDAPVRADVVEAAHASPLYEAPTCDETPPEPVSGRDAYAAHWAYKTWADIPELEHPGEGCDAREIKAELFKGPTPMAPLNPPATLRDACADAERRIEAVEALVARFRVAIKAADRAALRSAVDDADAIGFGGDPVGDAATLLATGAVDDGAGKESELPKGSSLGRFPLVSADSWTSDHLSERSRSLDAFFRNARARNTHVEAISLFPPRSTTTAASRTRGCGPASRCRAPTTSAPTGATRRRSRRSRRSTPRASCRWSSTSATSTSSRASRRRASTTSARASTTRFCYSRTRRGTRRRRRRSRRCGRTSTGSARTRRGCSTPSSRRKRRRSRRTTWPTARSCGTRS